MKPKLLLIEDSNDDAELAIASLTEAGEEFDYVHVRRLGDAMWELEGTPKNTYQKIYLDLGLSEVKGQAQSVINELAKYVGRENIIAVSAHPQSGTSQKIREGGVQVLGREQFSSSDNNLLASLFFNQQISHQKSVARHKELARIEIKLAQLEQEVDLRFENDLEHRQQLTGMVKELKSDVALLEDRMNVLEVQAVNTSTLNIKKFEVRWQLLIALIGTSAGAMLTAIAPKLVEMLQHKP